MQHPEWPFESVPDSFWQRIEAAHGDPDRFRASLADMSKEDMREMFDQYNELADQLFSSAHLAQMSPDATEDTAMDIAAWVVMQGKDYYAKVFADPTLTPRERQSHEMSFASILVLEFGDRFDEPI